MAKLSELQSKVTGKKISVQPLPQTKSVIDRMNEGLEQRLTANIPDTVKRTALPSTTSNNSSSTTGKKTTNPLFTPIKSGPLKGLSLLPSSTKDAARTVGYTAERMGSALLGVVEGVTDLLGTGIGKTVQGVASVGGRFPNSVSEWGEDVAKHFLNTSPTQAWEESIERRYNPSQGARNVTGVGQTIMQMVPAIRAASAVSTAWNAVNASQAASRGANVGRAIMGVQAAGNAASEAAAEGADTNQALAYGLTSGLLETTIEGIAGGIPGLGRGKIGEIADAVKANHVVRRALDIAGEGGEGALSTVLSPYLKRAIYDQDAPNATAEEIAQSAVMGAVAAGVLQAGLELPSAIGDRIRTRREAQTLPNVERTQTQTLPNLREQAEPASAAAQAVQQPISAVSTAEPSAPMQVKKQGVQIPVENRTWEDASSRKVNAFQYDHPELHPYYVNAAQALQYELSSGIKAERFPVKDADGAIVGYSGVPRAQASPVVRALDDAKLSYKQIDKALSDIINDRGQENYAAAKKMELVLDEMLSEGYTDVEGRRVEPDEAYIAARDAVNRGFPPDSTEYRMSEEEWNSILSQEVGPESSVGAARAGFDPWSHFQGTRSQFIPEGANAARPVDVPTTDPQGRPIRRTASTAMGAQAIPDEAVADIQNMVLRGELSYNRVTDKASVERAVRTIQEKGFERSLEEFSSQVRKGVVSKDMATLGQQLLINAANARDGKATAELLSLYAQMETTAGQAVQAASILRKLAPNDQLYAIQRTVSQLEKTIQKKYKDFNLTIDQAMIEEFQQQTTQEGRDAVMDKIYQNVADQVPATWRDKWNAWRYMAMLLNPRTHIRNIAGNVGFQPVRWTKDRVAAAIEAGVSKASGGKLQRTKSFVYNPSLYREAWNDWTNVKDALSGNKYDDVGGQIESRRRIFRTKPLEAARKGNSWALEQEDAIFKRITYADALAGYLQANGVTAEQLRNNTVDAQLMAQARDYAGQEALKATYQDRNAASDKVVQIANALGPFGEAVLPFKRTPANILVRGFEYSPAGLAKALSADLVQVRRGNMTGAEAIDHIAAGLTGSGLFALGAYLFAQGIVSSGGGDDDKQDALDDLTGGQSYALNLPGGGNVTLDWLAPEALPFFMGVDLMDSMGQNGFTAESVMDALASISEPMLELSMLQSMNDLIDSVSYADSSEKISGLVGSALISYFTQAIPTLGGQIERTGEDKRMSTYTDKNSSLPTDIQYALGRASARIPVWDYQQIPYIDAWGREETTGTLPMRAMNNFLNPAYTSSMNVTPVDAEVQRLYTATGDGSVVPERPNKYITVDGERIDLTGEQYVQYATQRGQMQFSMLEELLDSPAYTSLSDAEKAGVVDDVYAYADAVSKAAISDYEPASWVVKTERSGISPGKAILYRAKLSSLEDGGMSQSEANEELRRLLYEDTTLTANQKSDLDKAILSDGMYIPKDVEVDYSNSDSFTVSQMSDSAQRKWELAKNWGMSAEDYARYYPIYAESGAGKTKDYKLRRLQEAGMSAAEANTFWELMRD